MTDDETPVAAPDGQPPTSRAATSDDRSRGASGRGARSAGRTPRHSGPTVGLVIGILLIVCGLASMGWIGYQYWGTNGPSREAAASEVSGLRSSWSDSGEPDLAAPLPGEAGASATPGQTASAAPKYTQEQLDKAMAILRIPALGEAYEVPILIGTSDHALERGVGWYEGTAKPGQVGNFALAGHRVTHGEPFARLLELKKGDQVVIETKTAIYTYELDQSPAQLTVKDVDTWVIDPVPGKSNVQPTQALITLTTCQDLFHSPDRSVGFGHLVDTKQK